MQNYPLLKFAKWQFEGVRIHIPYLVLKANFDDILVFQLHS